MTDELVDEMRQSALMIRTWIPEVYPTNEDGQVHFARAIMESVADVIDKAIAVAPRRSAEMPEKERWQAWARKRLEIQRKHWLRAAKAALAGDTRELRNRVELCEAEAVEITQSDGQTVTIDT